MKNLVIAVCLLMMMSGMGITLIVLLFYPGILIMPGILALVFAVRCLHPDVLRKY